MRRVARVPFFIRKRMSLSLSTLIKAAAAQIRKPRQGKSEINTLIMPETRKKNKNKTKKTLSLLFALFAALAKATPHPY
ncbi:hypothetical protein ACN38_g7635 [Penicillium nordicum]|uniref:Uncharacterized protein n=1 Tax=Penicillium nordicum TaxID=229535 RepID=A0A0M9WE88_9EURO|nr:hypothetical protein ACN38_g7635 [Penicillium nordicum]